MLTRFKPIRLRVAIAVCLLVPTGLLAQDAPAQPAPAAPPKPAAPTPAAEPAVPPAPAPVPAPVPATPAVADPAQPVDATAEEPATTPSEAADGVAKVPTAGCRAYGVGKTCGPQGCRAVAGGQPSAGCNACGSATNQLGGCMNGACPNSAPCFATSRTSLSPEVCAGRPYTVGDLKRDLWMWECGVKQDLGLGPYRQPNAVDFWLQQQRMEFECRRAYRNHVWGAHLHNKMNYFKPRGCCGEGCAPFGQYERIYATQPDYWDARDSQLYAAPATNVPTAIPLPPNVHYQYNFGWGTPSSRLTPVSSLVRPRF